MNVNEGNMDKLFNKSLYELGTWSAGHTKSCDCMTSATMTNIIYLESLAECY